MFSTERVDPAEPPGRGRHCTSEGKSFRQDWYEAIPGRLLAEVSATPEPLVRAVLDSLQAEPVVRPSELALARIDRQVAEASARLAKTRDIGDWQATMARLDAEKDAILAAAPRPVVEDTADVAAFLRDLGNLWSRSEARIKQELTLAFWGSWEVPRVQVGNLPLVRARTPPRPRPPRPRGDHLRLERARAPQLAGRPVHDPGCVGRRRHLQGARSRGRGLGGRAL